MFLQSFSPRIPGISAIEFHWSDRTLLLHDLYQWASFRSLPVFHWSPAFKGWRSLSVSGSSLQWQPCPSEFGGFASPDPGLYLLEGFLGGGGPSVAHQLLQLHSELGGRHPQAWVLLESDVALPLELQSLIPVHRIPLPDRLTLSDWVGRQMQSRSLSSDAESLASLIRAAQGLPIGELLALFDQHLAGGGHTVAQLAIAILDHKLSKLRGRGLQFTAKPDVPKAGGLDLLEARLNEVIALMSPHAAQYGLMPPKGMILWGPPGTGKSLSAKLAADRMGVPLLGADWGQLLGAASPDRALRELLELAEALSPTVLWLDDFEKLFSLEGGAQRRLAGKMLTWLQEHTALVYTMATVNRLEMLPPELVRRFPDIFFVDLPHAGGYYEIFCLHLQRYFPNFDPEQWTDSQWRSLLNRYQLCTPDEIGKAVKGVAERAFFAGHPGQLRYEAMLMQREQFTPAMVRDEASIVAIRNRAIYAKPASGPDTSRFAVKPKGLFEWDSPSVGADTASGAEPPLLSGAEALRVLGDGGSDRNGNGH